MEGKVVSGTAALHQMAEPFQIFLHGAFVQKAEQLQHQLDVGVAAQFIYKMFFGTITHKREATKSAFAQMTLLEKVRRVGHRYESCEVGRAVVFIAGEDTAGAGAVQTDKSAVTNME